MRLSLKNLTVLLTGVWIAVLSVVHAGGQSAGMDVRVSVSPGCTVHVADGWIVGEPVTSGCGTLTASPLVTTEAFQPTELIATDAETVSRPLDTISGQEVSREGTSANAPRFTVAVINF